MCNSFDELLAEHEEFDKLPYTLVVFTARYGGTYEGGRCIALNEAPGHPVLGSATGGDLECANWFDMYELSKPVGRGRTHAEAILDLKAKLDAEPEKAWPEFVWGFEPREWW